MPRVTKAQMRQDELTRAKLEMVAARERGEDALRPLLAQHPALAGELIDFSAALAATSAYAAIELAPETEAVALQARDRAFAAVFGAAPAIVKAPAFASLKALRQARKVSMPALATKLGLGVDVVSALEAGRIRAASVATDRSGGKDETRSPWAECRRASRRGSDRRRIGPG